MTGGLGRRIVALGRLPAQRPRDVARVGLAPWCLLRALVSLRLAPKGRLLAAAARADAAPTDRIDGAERARQLVLAVDRAAEYGLFRPTCLVRSLALERMLEREGIEGGVVRIGARHRNGRPEMHAWIEICGTAIGERPEVTNTFTPLQDFTAVRRA